MGRIRIPEHIQETAKHIVVLNVEVQNENRIIEQEMADIEKRRQKIDALNEKLLDEENNLLEQCRAWVKQKES